MTTETRDECVARLLSAIASADRDAEYFAACSEFLKAEQKRAEGLALRRSLARFTRPTLPGLAAPAPGGAPAPSRVPPEAGRYRISIRQLFGLEVG